MNDRGAELRAEGTREDVSYALERRVNRVVTKTGRRRVFGRHPLGRSTLLSPVNPSKGERTLKVRLPNSSGEDEYMPLADGARIVDSLMRKFDADPQDWKLVDGGNRVDDGKRIELYESESHRVKGLTFQLEMLKEEPFSRPKLDVPDGTVRVVNRPTGKPGQNKDMFRVVGPGK